MKIQLPHDVTHIINELNSADYEAYVVGGCVRDSIMNKTPHDWDICTSALPEDVMDVFKNNNVITTGLKHGTVTVVFNKQPYEITTYRIDKDYNDHRRPGRVSFTDDLIRDLARRDFTINAMAYHPNEGLIDPFNGRYDIKSKTIRCVGNPDERFTEDALRIMRAVRFAVTLGFTICPDTQKSIDKHKNLLRYFVSMERISSELKKALTIDYNFRLGELLQVVIPELSDESICDAAYVMKDRKLSFYTRLAYLFKNVDTTAALTKLRFDRATIKTINDIQRIADRVEHIPWGKLHESTATKVALRINDEATLDAIDYLYILHINDTQSIMPSFTNLMRQVLPITRTEPYKISHLAVNGNDMKSLGLKDHQIGKMLTKILNAVITHELSNEYDAQMQYAKDIMESRKE